MRIIDLPFERRTMANVLRDQGEQIGDTTWVKFEGATWTFAEADRLVDAYARGLQRAGVERGTQVAVMMENGPEFLWTAMALYRLGAVFVPVNTAYKARYLAHVLGHSEAEVVVVDGGLAERVAEVEEGLPLLRSVVVLGEAPTFAGVRPWSLEELAGTAGSAVDCPTSATDLMCILYTSGTTGLAKGAMMSNNYWYDATLSLKDRRDVRDDDVFYVSSPMFHAAAWICQIFSPLMLGLACAIDRRFSVSEFWNRVRHYRATQFFTMAGSHLWLLNAPPRPDDRDNPARVWGPIPLAPELHEPFKERFGIEKLWFTYGQTEAMCVTCSDANQPYSPGTAGWARDTVELAVVDDYDRELPRGEVGELVVRGKTPFAIMDGYWRQAQETVDAFRNLWYHTGDFVTMNEAGEVFFVDRKKDYLRIRGENISSFEVEITVQEHPKVGEAAAYAIPAPDGVGDEELMLTVVVAEGELLDADEVAAFCNERLPYFAMPRYIDFIDEFPRTPTGRVQKYQLRERGVTSGTWDRIEAGFKVTR
jgi:crotonobetaine/carnitine-CoA ligase